MEGDVDRAGTHVEVLAAIGCTATVATNTDMAVRAAALFQPAIMMVDDALPQAQAMELMATVRRINQKCPPLFFCATDMRCDDRNPGQLFDMMVLKPLDPLALREMVAAVSGPGTAESPPASP